MAIKRLPKILRPKSWVVQLARVKYRLTARRFRVRARGVTDYRVQFDYRSLSKAKAVILWYDDWEKATEATLDTVDRLGLVHDRETVIDFGCGIGRIAVALRKRHNVHVYAVDRSATMRDHARMYITSDDLRSGAVTLLSDEELLERTHLAGSVDCILMIEVLQHIPEPILDTLLPKLLTMLKPQGRLFVLGNEFLDVDRFGNTDSRIEPVLSRHGQIIKRDRWTNGFVIARHSFVVVPLAAKPPTQVPSPAVVSENSSPK